MKKVLVVEYLISLPHATRMMKKLSIKKHVHVGYFFELDDPGPTFRAGHLTPRELGMCYSRYKSDTQVFHLKVFREVSEKT